MLSKLGCLLWCPAVYPLWHNQNAVKVPSKHSTKWRPHCKDWELLISQEKIFLFIRLLLQFSNFRKSEMLHFFFKDARSRKSTTLPRFLWNKGVETHVWNICQILTSTAESHPFDFWGRKRDFRKRWKILKHKKILYFYISIT